MACFIQHATFWSFRRVQNIEMEQTSLRLYRCFSLCAHAAAELYFFTPKMKRHSKCPNCGRNLTENEMYCHFCELEIEARENRRFSWHRKSVECERVKRAHSHLTGFSRESKTKKKNKNKK